MIIINYLLLYNYVKKIISALNNQKRLTYIKTIYIMKLKILFTPLEFFTSALADGLSLEFE